jgi:hypothetical protein
VAGTYDFDDVEQYRHGGLSASEFPIRSLLLEIRIGSNHIGRLSISFAGSIRRAFCTVDSSRKFCVPSRLLTTLIVGMLLLRRFGALSFLVSLFHGWVASAHLQALLRHIDDGTIGTPHEEQTIPSMVSSIDHPHSHPGGTGKIAEVSQTHASPPQCHHQHSNRWESMMPSTLSRTSGIDFNRFLLP